MHFKKQTPPALTGDRLVARERDKMREGGGCKLNGEGGSVYRKRRGKGSDEEKERRKGAV